MDKISREEIFFAILSSNILLPYVQSDPELDILLEDPNHCNIHYPRNYATVDQIKPALMGMLDYMTAQRIYLNVEATKQLIAFAEKYPDSLIYDITFNCERQSYGVCCGLIGEKIDVICVLTGNHIPDELFGDSPS